MSATSDHTTPPSGGTTQTQDVIMTNPTALSELEAYWSSLPRTRGIPKRNNVDPAAMGGLLEDSFILERVAPGVARIRVAGRNLTKLVGVEPRGLPLTAVILPESRADMAHHIEAAFTGPNIVELSLVAPRAVGQPLLQGKILMLPLLDDHGRVSRVLGVLVMSGRRGIGGRRFAISTSTPARIDPIVGLRAIAGGKPTIWRPSPHLPRNEKAEVKPALRLVVCNS